MKRVTLIAHALFVLLMFGCNPAPATPVPPLPESHSTPVDVDTAATEGYPTAQDTKRLYAPVSPPLTANEVKYLPVLKKQVDGYWPEFPRPSYLAAQVRQETCPGLKSPKCWSPHAELKTSREYGFGLGQITVTAKFNNFEAAKKLDTSLAHWAWDDRYRPEYQLRTLVLMDRACFNQFRDTADADNQMAMAFACYNGGAGGVLSDRAVCRSTPGCDPRKWWGNVEHTSRKQKKPSKGYGQSFFQINRAYPVHIMREFPSRYAPYFGD